MATPDNAPSTRRRAGYHTQSLAAHASLHLGAYNLMATAGEAEPVVVADHALFHVTEDYGQVQLRCQHAMLVGEVRTHRSLIPHLLGGLAASRCVIFPALTCFNQSNGSRFFLAHRDSFHPYSPTVVKRNFLLGSKRNFSLGRDIKLKKPLIPSAFVVESSPRGE
jgi:hypothetical protein